MVIPIFVTIIMVAFMQEAAQRKPEKFIVIQEGRKFECTKVQGIDSCWERK